VPLRSIASHVSKRPVGLFLNDPLDFYTQFFSFLIFFRPVDSGATMCLDGKSLFDFIRFVFPILFWDLFKLVRHATHGGLDSKLCDVS